MDPCNRTILRRVCLLLAASALVRPVLAGDVACASPQPLNSAMGTGATSLRPSTRPDLTLMTVDVSVYTVTNGVTDGFFTYNSPLNTPVYQAQCCLTEGGVL